MKTRGNSEWVIVERASEKNTSHYNPELPQQKSHRWHEGAEDGKRVPRRMRPKTVQFCIKAIQETQALKNNPNRTVLSFLNSTNLEFWDLYIVNVRTGEEIPWSILT